MAHGGTPGSSTATLALKQFNATNPAGDSFFSSSTGGGALRLVSDGSAISISAGGIGIDLSSTGDGVKVVSSAMAMNLAGATAGVSIANNGLTGSALVITGNTNSPDILLSGDGLLQADLGGRILGNTATAFAGNGVQVDKTGYALSSTGANLVLVDGKTLPAALQYIAASTAGKISGAGTGTEIFLGLDGATTRLTITVDASGNRSAVVYA